MSSKKNQKPSSLLQDIGLGEQEEPGKTSFALQQDGRYSPSLLSLSTTWWNDGLWRPASLCQLPWQQQLQGLAWISSSSREAEMPFSKYEDETASPKPNESSKMPNTQARVPLGICGEHLTSLSHFTAQARAANGISPSISKQGDKGDPNRSGINISLSSLTLSTPALPINLPPKLGALFVFGKTFQSIHMHRTKQCFLSNPREPLQAGGMVSRSKKHTWEENKKMKGEREERKGGGKEGGREEAGREDRRDGRERKKEKKGRKEGRKEKRKKKKEKRRQEREKARNKKEGKKEKRKEGKKEMEERKKGKKEDKKEGKKERKRQKDRKTERQKDRKTERKKERKKERKEGRKAPGTTSWQSWKKLDLQTKIDPWTKPDLLRCQAKKLASERDKWCWPNFAKCCMLVEGHTRVSA
ncbi:Pxr1, partial [Ophiophagus hannah]